MVRWHNILEGDSDKRQREDIDQNADSVEELYKRLRELQGQFKLLATTTGVLLDMLEERGLLDEGEVHRRVDEAMRPPAPPETPSPPPVMSGDPYRGGPASHAPIETTQCVRCGKTVRLQATNLTGDGPVCDPCFAKAGS
jgi:hypothetical protein